MVGAVALYPAAGGTPEATTPADTGGAGTTTGGVATAAEDRAGQLVTSGPQEVTVKTDVK